MTLPLATYSFLPWLRQGLANQITSADFDPNVTLRAVMPVKLELTGRSLGGGTVTEPPIERDVALYGPGDIQGIDSRAIVRVEPRHWITNFEPNYLPCIEFYDEDFPWRYTPAAPDLAKGRLRPWITLVVLAEGEFSDGTDTVGKPLPYVEVPDLAVFPPAEQLWAWAHVHVNRTLAGSDTEFTSTNMAAVLPRLEALLAEDPDLAYARLVSPRKLAENSPYHAFLMPTFETGRLAGLGLDPAPSPNATFSAWATYPAGPRPEGQRFPYYHRWFFRTATAGDFESLVRLLVPRPVDKRVGIRDMDVLAPGSNLPPIDDPELGGVLKLGGALRVPRAAFTAEELEEVDRYEDWDEPYPHKFQRSLARLVDLADDYAESTAAAANSATQLGPEVEDDPDPLITPPLYGTWHALTKRLLRDRDGNALHPADNWVHELNLDPRHRVAAGFGTRVVQDRQETLMQGAWEQVGRVLEANRRVRLGQLAKGVSLVWYDTHLRPLLGLDQQGAMRLMAPLNRRVVRGALTVHGHLAAANVRPALTSSALRRMVRPRGRLTRTLPYTENVRPTELTTQVNKGAVSAAPPKTIPPRLPTVDRLADRIVPEDRGRLEVVVRRLPRPTWPLLARVFERLTPQATARLALDGIREANLRPKTVNRLPKITNFQIMQPGSDFQPRPGDADSQEGRNFKQGLRDSYAVLAASAQAGALIPNTTLDLDGLTEGMFGQLDPDHLIPARVRAGIHLPSRITDEVGEAFVEAMAYPEFDLPMYEPLKDLSAELFLPNLNLVPQNSVTLLETNQRFIEAYMVGLNHELARELLWREYPTDQRGSYFRQFWDVSGYLDTEGLDPAALKEKLRDIPPLHLWSKASGLGDHDNREEPGDESEEEVVLVIRGELLKRYPTAVVYAHRACWQRKGNGNSEPCLRSGAIDNTQERRLTPLTAAEELNPPRDKVKTPLYEAKVDPDISFFGFDLTVDEARGETGEDPDDDPGWFFVIKERPGEPRFGLDIDQQPDVNVWNDLAWPDVQPGLPGSYLEITNATPTIPLVAPTDPEEQEKEAQHDEDVNVSWSKNMSAADLAYILFQAPVLVAVHASEMLPTT